jgi:hypothetical protein
MEPEVSLADQDPEVINVAMSAILVLVSILWLVAFMSGKTAVMGQILGPYLPSWILLANLGAVPVTCALAGSRAVSFRTNFLFILIFLAQMSLLPLSGENYPIPKALAILFVYLETFLFLPKWNRRILERGQDGTILHF